MLRKKALRRVFDVIIENDISPRFLEKGFVYKKSKKLFVKEFNGFDVSITPSISTPSLVYREESEKLLFYFDLRTTIKCSKFEKWHESNFETKPNLVKSLGMEKCYQEIQFDVFESSDFFTPTPSQQFKSNMLTALAKNRGVAAKSIEGYFDNDFELLLTKIEDNCTHLEGFKKKDRIIDFNYANLLVFQAELEKAKIEYNLIYDTLSQRLNKYRSEKGQDHPGAINMIKNIAKGGKQFFDLDFEIPKPLAITSSFQNIEIDFPETNLKFKEVFSLPKPSRRINSFCISPSGRLIVGHKDRNTKDGFITIWENDGTLLLELELDTQGKTHTREVHVGYLGNCNLFFANQYLINQDLDCFKLELPDAGSKNKPLGSHFSIPIRYDEKAERFIAYAIYEKESYVVFYDKTYNLVKKLAVTLRPLDIIIKKQWILLYKYSSYISIIDYDGNEIAQLKDNNVNDTGGLWYLNNYHAISPSNKYLFTFFYYVKSKLFDLETMNHDVLWGHTTYMKNYKEQYYNDINHNFGVYPAKFSPNEKYIIAGADHGKYVAWTLPDKKRVELIPNAAYLKKMPDALIYEVKGVKYLKNRGHKIKDIAFWENGKYFSLIINDDLLIWNDKFEHISTVYEIAPFGFVGKLLGFYNKYIGILKFPDQNSRGEIVVLKR